MEHEALKPVGGTREAFEKWAKTLPNYMDITRFENGYSDCNTDYAWAAWQAALAQPAQEPVACIHKGYLYMAHEFMSGIPDGATLLYTAPPQRPWVGLTDAEIWSTVSRIGTADSNVNPYQILNDARAIEAKLKEKNT